MPKRNGIGGRIGRIEGRVGREREQPGEVGGRALRQRAVPAVRRADLERVIAAPPRLDPRQRVVEGDVANQILRVGVPRPGDVVRVGVLRADIERVDAGKADELPVVVEQLLGPWSRFSRTWPNFSSLVVRLFSTDVHDPLNTWSPESFSCRAALENRQVVLDRIALGDDGLARPAEADLVVAVHVVVEPRERVRPVERRSSSSTTPPAAPPRPGS